MGKKEVIWTKKAQFQMFMVMDYYNYRNKSNLYSLKLYAQINDKLNKIRDCLVLPKQTSIKDIFYFTHKHISVIFTFDLDKIIVLLIWDDRRNPKELEKLLIEI